MDRKYNQGKAKGSFPKSQNTNSRRTGRAPAHDSSSKGGFRPQPKAHSVSGENNYDRDDLIEGRNPCLEALEAGRSINRIMIAKGSHDSTIAKIMYLAKEARIPLAEVERSALDKISVVGSHQGVIALASAKEYCTVDDILNRAANLGHAPFIVILDGINDPNNFGAIIRSAECAGVDGIIIPERRSVQVTPVVAKVSAGACEHMMIARVVNISATIRELKEKGLWIVGTDGGASQMYKDVDYKGPIALIIGSEGEGMSRVVMSNCDHLVKIPLMGKVNSLNAATAAAIVMFEAVSQRCGL